MKKHSNKIKHSFKDSLYDIEYHIAIPKNTHYSRKITINYSAYNILFIISILDKLHANNVIYKIECKDFFGNTNSIKKIITIHDSQ